MDKNNNDDLNIGLKKLPQISAEAGFEERFFTKLTKMNSVESRLIFSRAFVLSIAFFTVYFFITLTNNSLIELKNTLVYDNCNLNENVIPENLKIGDSFFPSDKPNSEYKVFDYTPDEKQKLDSLKIELFKEK